MSNNLIRVILPDKNGKKVARWIKPEELDAISPAEMKVMLKDAAQYLPEPTIGEMISAIDAELEAEAEEAYWQASSEYNASHGEPFNLIGDTERGEEAFKEVAAASERIKAKLGEADWTNLGDNTRKTVSEAYQMGDEYSITDTDSREGFYAYCEKMFIDDMDGPDDIELSMFEDFMEDILS